MIKNWLPLKFPRISNPLKFARRHDPPPLYITVIFILDDELDIYLSAVKEEYNKEEIDFDHFARVVAIILEDASYNNQEERLDDDYWIFFNIQILKLIYYFR